MRKLHLATALLGLAAASPALHAQRGNRVHDVPPRPALWAGADTNSASVYYLWAMQHVGAEPVKAAAAFYWAERLKPGWADALYGRRMALLMSDPQRMVDYEDGKAYVLRNPETLAVDSLALRAAQRSPFLYTAFEKQYWELYLRTVYREMIRRETGSDNAVDAEYLMRLTLGSLGPEMRAWNDYSAGRFPWRRRATSRPCAARRARSGCGCGWRRSALWGNAEQAATAFAEASAARHNDRRDMVHVYESKAEMEYSPRRRAANSPATQRAPARHMAGRWRKTWRTGRDTGAWPALAELRATPPPRSPRWGWRWGSRPPRRTCTSITGRCC